MPTVGWFILQGLASLGTLCLGLRLGRGPLRRAWLWLALGMTVLIYWAWLKHHPAVAVYAIPLAVLCYIEGTGAVPAFMLVVGIAYARSRLPHERRVAVLAAALGLIYFLHGSLWMLQSTPTQSFAQTQTGVEVRQSQNYSCVPAACATALNHLGVASSEAEMAELTQTRPGSGATLIRAMEALQRKLAGTDIQVKMLEPEYSQLLGLDMPLLTPLRLELGRHHMVTVLRADELGAWVADPLQGNIFVPRDKWQKAYINDKRCAER